MSNYNEEEKKAIDYYENNEYSFGFEADFDIENFKKAIGIEETDEDTFERHQIRFKTLLNLIEKQQKELKQNEKQIDRYQNMLATNDMLHVMECENKDKVIEKMSLKIAKVDNSDTYCCGKKRMCPYDNPTLSKCAECVKKYYEKRCKK